MYNYRLKKMHRVSNESIEYNPKCQTSCYSPYVPTKFDTRIVSFNEDNFQSLRTNLNQLKEYIFCFEQQFSNYSNLLVEIDDANDEIKEQLNSMHRPMFSEPKFKKVGGSSLQSYYLGIDNFLEHTVPSLLYLANQVEKNENKFPNKVYDIILGRLSSQTFRNFFESNVYFKKWLETDKDIEELDIKKKHFLSDEENASFQKEISKLGCTEDEEMPANATSEQIRQSVESECA
jgi:hypothetical protein